MTETLDFTIDDGIAVISIDVSHQSMNVITEAFLDEFEAVVDRVLSEDAIEGAVIASAKADFLAGADLHMLGQLTEMAKTADPGEVYDQAVRLNRLFRKLETGGQPVKELQTAKTKPFVAAVAGQALGGGFELALACHARVAADDGAVKFGCPEVQVGLLPGAGGTQRLPRITGIQAALQYLTTGKTISGKEAQGFGIVQALAAREAIVETAKALAKETGRTLQPWDQKGFKVPGGGGAMNPNAVQTFMGANAMARERTYGNYPAVQYILSCVYEGSITGIDWGLQIESKYFTRLLTEGQAGRMIRTFFVNKTAAEKGARRPRGIEKRPTQKLAMLGAGLMGGGIAYVAAKAGIAVVLLDKDHESAESGKQYAQTRVEKDVARKKMGRDEADALLARIHPTADYADLQGADLVIEAVFEDRQVKAEATKKALDVLGNDVIFGSNTSTLPITSLAEAAPRPANFIGIHFFSPVEKMPLIEIILGEQTGDEATAKALDFARQIKKTPIVVNDSRGFYTSRCFGTYVREGYCMVAEGVNPALIENAGKMLSMPVGPLAVGDEVAIDLSYKVMKATEKDLGEAYERSPADEVVELFVEKLGRYGRKNGKGMYDYPEDGSEKRLWPGIQEHFAPADEQPDVEEVKARLLYRQMVECARCFAEGVLTDPADGDLGAIFGWGFAPWTGGPFSYIDFLGAQAVVAEADRLAERYGAGFQVPDQLREMVETSETYHKQTGLQAAAE